MDVWDETDQAFPEIWQLPRLTDEELQRLHDDYCREQIEAALSEAAFKANQEAYRK